MYKSLLMIVCLMACVACEHVAPWQRGNLARPEMAFAPDPLEAALDDHVYFSKEASSSGAAVTGGGCGCN